MSVSPETRLWLLEMAKLTVKQKGPLPEYLIRDIRKILTDSDNSGVPSFENGQPEAPGMTMDLRDRPGIGQVAQAVGLSPQWLRRLAETGKVRAWRAGPGCRWRVDVDSARDYMARRGDAQQDTESAGGDRRRAGGQAA